MLFWLRSCKYSTHIHLCARIVHKNALQQVERGVKSSQGGSWHRVKCAPTKLWDQGRFHALTVLAHTASYTQLASADDSTRLVYSDVHALVHAAVREGPAAAILDDGPLVRRQQHQPARSSREFQQRGVQPRLVQQVHRKAAHHQVVGAARQAASLHVLERPGLNSGWCMRCVGWKRRDCRWGPIRARTGVCGAGIIAVPARACRASDSWAAPRRAVRLPEPDHDTHFPSPSGAPHWDHRLTVAAVSAHGKRRQ